MRFLILLTLSAVRTRAKPSLGSVAGAVQSICESRKVSFDNVLYYDGGEADWSGPVTAGGILLGRDVAFLDVDDPADASKRQLAVVLTEHDTDLSVFLDSHWAAYPAREMWIVEEISSSPWWQSTDPSLLPISSQIYGLDYDGDNVTVQEVIMITD